MLKYLFYNTMCSRYQFANSWRFTYTRLWRSISFFLTGSDVTKQEIRLIHLHVNVCLLNLLNYNTLSFVTNPSVDKDIHNCIYFIRVNIDFYFHLVEYFSIIFKMLFDILVFFKPCWQNITCYKKSCKINIKA